MSMAWLKLARWFLLGVIGLSGAAACGGRGSLPGYGGDELGGDSAFGGSSTAGTGVGGKAGAGGGNVAGSSGACSPGSMICQGNAVAKCDGAGRPGAPKACAPDQTCVQSGNRARCTNQSQLCKPNSLQCDPTGELVQACSADGSSLSTAQNCAARGLRCDGGTCVDLFCKPNALFCDSTGLRLCNAAGTGSTSWLDCAPGQYCDPLVLACRQGVCMPNQAVCRGYFATACNADGSGYTGAGVDCGMRGQLCVGGSCVCPAGLGNCDGIASNGCEAPIARDRNNCNGCGLVCSSNHVADRTCNDGCDGTCDSGYQDCNGTMLKDGCETNVNGDANNCGRCGLSCSTNHVTPSCALGQCNGKCAANFADCNSNKQADGCESDLRSDASNCNGCGIICSSNHVKPSCSAGTCSGACAAGFADCNADKQADGCEIDTQTDRRNCGACGNVCGADEGCAAGKCVALLKFSGVAQNVPVSSLIGWSQCYVETYGEGKTTIGMVQKSCSGSLLMMGCRVKGSGTLQLVAYAPRDDVMFDTGSSNVPHNANGVGWYFNESISWGFAPEGDPITRSTCDTQASSGQGGVDGDKRICWHTSGGYIQGGWRCGLKDGLNSDFNYERLLFTAQ
jgi:hypothetical protein